MKYLIPLIHLSAKESFKLLREKAPLFCTALNAGILVGKQFLKHISDVEKRRHKHEILERLLLIPFLQKILQNGKKTETRTQNKRIFHRISESVGNQVFSVIILEVPKRFLLVSCFIDTKYSKKDLS